MSLRHHTLTHTDRIFLLLVVLLDGGWGCKCVRPSFGTGACQDKKKRTGQTKGETVAASEGSRVAEFEGAKPAKTDGPMRIYTRKKKGAEPLWQIITLLRREILPDLPHTHVGGRRLARPDNCSVGSKCRIAKPQKPDGAEKERKWKDVSSSSSSSTSVGQISPE